MSLKTKLIRTADYNFVLHIMFTRGEKKATYNV